jgi:glycosyltransferase involved in cell wall biosynthesis
VYSLEGIAARFSDAELVQNPEDLALLHRWHISPHAELLGNGVDLQRFDPTQFTETRREAIRHEQGVAPDTVVVGTVGRLVAEKGFPELVEACARFDGWRAVLLVVGGTDDTKSDALGAELAGDANPEAIRLLGHRDDVERLYAAMDVFVLASHREGFPRAAMEAAAMGLPIIATNVRGCRQIVDDGRNGLLVPVRAPSALRAAIERLVGDADLRRRMGAASREIAQQRFDERLVVSRVLAAYQRAAARKGRRPPPAPG